jgi:hypothetical protein
MACEVCGLIQLVEVLVALERMRLQCFPYEMDHERGMRWIGSRVGCNKLE